VKKSPVVLPQYVKSGDKVVVAEIKDRWLCKNCGEIGLQKHASGFSDIGCSPKRCPRCKSRKNTIWSYMGTATLITGDTRYASSVGARLIRH